MNQVFSSSIPSRNRRIGNVYNFLKICIQKHVSPELAWDKVTQIAHAAYNFVPNGHSKESALFLMFGWDVHTPLLQLLHLKVRYMGNEKSLLALDALKDIHALAVHNIKLPRKTNCFPIYPIPEFPVKETNGCVESQIWCCFLCGTHEGITTGTDRQAS